RLIDEATERRALIGRQLAQRFRRELRGCAKDCVAAMLAEACNGSDGVAADFEDAANRKREYHPDRGADRRRGREQASVCIGVKQRDACNQDCSDNEGGGLPARCAPHARPEQRHISRPTRASQRRVVRFQHEVTIVSRHPCAHEVLHLPPGSRALRRVAETWFCQYSCPSVQFSMQPVETFFFGGGGFPTTFIHRRFEWRAAAEEFALLAEALAHNTGDDEINP